MKKAHITTYRERLIIPICDARGRVIAFGGRILVKDDKQPKYINSPENIVYTKGRHLFGLNVAKKGDTKKLLIVEGYMDVISLHQRGITNVVGALGTALTEQQGWLLRKSTEQVILGFDADGAGQNAVVRSMEILQNMGCDMRVLQMEGAKDPDEYIIKYGTARFSKLMENAISILEYKVKKLKQTLNLDNAGDKIKFLNEIAKLISKVDNNIEKEIYISKISKEYNISQEAIFAEVNKIAYKKQSTPKQINKPKVQINQISTETEENVTEERKKLENTVIALLLEPESNSYNTIKEQIKAEDFKYKPNKQIVEILYKEFEKQNFNITAIIDTLEEKLQNQITAIMAYDFGIEDTEKATQDVIIKYEKERLNSRKIEILNLLGQPIENEKKKELEKELSDIIIKLAKM